MKKLMVAVFCVVLFIGSVAELKADSDKDYKVIKNAFKSRKKELKGNFCVVVKDIKDKSNKFSLTVPLSIIEMIAENAEDEYSLKDGSSFDLKKVLKMLKNNGKSSKIEVRGGDSIIRVWVE